MNWEVMSELGSKMGELGSGTGELASGIEL